MSPSSSLIAAALVVAATAVAQAEAPPMPRGMYVPVPSTAIARETDGTSNVSSRIVYLKRCPLVAGCTITAGTSDDSRTDTSSIAEGAPGSQRIIGEFSQSTTVWNDFVSCVKTTFAPFDITITDVDPGNVPHFMNIVGGKGSHLNAEFAQAGGVAPFRCGNEIPNAIVYTFDIYGASSDHLCWTSAQEIAHAFGLEHQFLQKDPLTYLDGDLPKRFRDVDAQCGEYAIAPCQCGTTQNTYRHIVGMFGPGAPTPPEVAFKRPVDGKEIQPGFKAVVDALDDVRTEKVEFYVDGALVGMTMTEIAGSFELVLPDLGAGDHMLEARATDVQGVVGSQTIAITQGPPCTPDKGCTGNDVCAGGVCVPGPEDAGGLGYPCQADTECLSHRCADGGEELKHCVETCNLNNSASCPNDFTCIAAGADGVCWPTPGGGCCNAGRDPRGALLLGLGVVLVLSRRRRPLRR